MLLKSAVILLPTLSYGSLILPFRVTLNLKREFAALLGQDACFLLSQCVFVGGPSFSPCDCI